MVRPFLSNLDVMDFSTMNKINVLTGRSTSSDENSKDNNYGHSKSPTSIRPHKLSDGVVNLEQQTML